jgi:predicted ArsR family transcriptional regulator
LLAHPVRSRILVALGGQSLSTRQIAEMFPDIPQATLYRQIDTLQKAGVVKQVEERPTRGNPERVYALAEEGALLRPEDLSTREQHLQAFTNFQAALMATFVSYISHADFDPKADKSGMLATGVQLDAQSLRELKGELASVMERYSSKADGPGTERLVLSFLLIPEKPLRFGG